MVSAFEPEIAPLRRLVRARPEVRLAAVGIGAVDAAAGAARAIASSGAGRVVFVGTAGVYAPGFAALPVGAVGVAAEIHLVSTAALRGDGYLPQPLIVEEATSPALRAGLAALTGNEPVAVACPLAITSSAALARRIAKATGASLENLEIFAIARACRAAKIPFAALLAVTNRVGPSGNRQWRAHHREASRAACRLMAAFLDHRA